MQLPHNMAEQNASSTVPEPAEAPSSGGQITAVTGPVLPPQAESGKGLAMQPFTDAMSQIIAGSGHKFGLAGILIDAGVQVATTEARHLQEALTDSQRETKELRTSRENERIISTRLQEKLDGLNDHKDLRTFTTFLGGIAAAEGMRMLITDGNAHFGLGISLTLIGGIVLWLNWQTGRK